MSYILEALKKSELARQQGVAALHYSLLPVVMEEDMIASRRWPYYVLGAGLALNVGVFYVWPAWSTYVAARNDVTTTTSLTTHVAPAPVVSKADIAVPAASVQTLPPTVPPAAAEVIAPPRHRKLANVAPLDVRVPSPEAAQPKIERKPARKEPELLSSAPAEPAPKAVVERTTRTVAAQESKAFAMPNAESGKASVRAPQAPAALKSELPALSVGGFIREDGSSGMVVVNDRLVREGDEVMPGLTVEKIQTDSVVFNYKGQRFVR